MSIEHRHNPDSDECQRMAREHRLDVLVAQMNRCLRCGRLIAPDYPTVTECCDDCDYEGERANEL